VQFNTSTYVPEKESLDKKGLKIIFPRKDFI